MQKGCLRFVALGNLSIRPMQSLANQWRRNSRALLIVGCMSAPVGCSSQYEPEGQFWTDVGPSSSGVSSTAAEAGAGGTDPAELEDDPTEAAVAPSEGASTSIVGRSPVSEPTTVNATTTAVVAASPTCS